MMPVEGNRTCDSSEWASAGTVQDEEPARALGKIFVVTSSRRRTSLGDRSDYASGDAWS